MEQAEILQLVEQIKKIYAEKGYAFFERGDYNLNLIGIREDDEFDNRFTDTLLCLYKVKGVWQCLQIPWTTMPGTYGGVFAPITVLGLTGTAVFKEGQYRGAYQFIDTSNNIYGSPYFAQVLPVTVFRDGDRDTHFDRDMPQQTGLFYILLHPMGDGEEINTWSIGCQGTKRSYFNQLIAVVRASIRHWGYAQWAYRFTYTLLHRNDFKQVSARRVKNTT